MSYDTYFRINGGHESGGGKRRWEEEEEEEKEEWMCGVKERDCKRAVREEFETLPTVTGPRETESAPAYNLKTHSAFKLLTMAAGYKVLCLYYGVREARRESWESEEG